jgi:hypothetical protein
LAGQDAELAAVLAAVVTDAVADARDVALVRASSSRASCRRICSWNWIGLVVVMGWKLRWKADTLMPASYATSCTRKDWV